MRAHNFDLWRQLHARFYTWLSDKATSRFCVQITEQLRWVESAL